MNHLFEQSTEIGMDKVIRNCKVTIMIRALEETNGNILKAAKLVKVQRTTFQMRMSKLGIVHLNGKWRVR